MSTKRFVATCAVAFLVQQICAILIHGFILRADYLPFYGTLLRPMDGSGGEGAWRMLFLPLSHLSFVISLVWVYARIAPKGAWVQEGLRFGALAYAIGQVPLWLLWYAEQPWPDSLVVKQLLLELVASLLLGLVVAAMARQPLGQRQLQERRA